MFGRPRKSKSTSTGTRGYWRLGLMDFRNFFHFGWPQKSRSTSGFGFLGYCRLGLMDFSISSFLTFHDVHESVLRCHTADVRETSKIQVNFRFSEVLKGTVDWVLWISVISSIPYVFDVGGKDSIVFRNFFIPYVSRQGFCCSVRVTSKIQVNFWFCRNSRVLTIGSYRFS